VTARGGELLEPFDDGEVLLQRAGLEQAMVATPVMLAEAL
jgi:hypothetical protein